MAEILQNFAGWSCADVGAANNTEQLINAGTLLLGIGFVVLVATKNPYVNQPGKQALILVFAIIIAIAVGIGLNFILKFMLIPWGC